MLDTYKRITAVTVNYRTPDLLRDCITSFANSYPNVTHIVIDNGECEESVEVVNELGAVLVQSHTNIGHGPALDLGIRLVSTTHVLTLDSDTKLKAGGFLELMLAEFDANPNLFALGWLRFTNAAGVAGLSKAGFPYIHPYASLLNVEKYVTLAPFIGQGAPAVNTMQDAVTKGYDLMDFPVQRYIDHKESGTRGHFGGVFKIAPGSKMMEWKKYKI